jgi:adenine/guanine phosphoribosyltransferase-like PRPP-binding protein
VIELLGAEVVGCSFMITLSFLSGAKLLSERRVSSLVVY